MKIETLAFYHLVPKLKRMKNRQFHLCKKIQANQSLRMTFSRIQSLARKRLHSLNLVQSSQVLRCKKSFSIYSIYIEHEMGTNEGEEEAATSKLDDPEDAEELKEKIRSKLKASRTNAQRSNVIEKVVPVAAKPMADEIQEVSDSDSDELGNELEKQRRIKRKKKA